MLMLGTFVYYLCVTIAVVSMIVGAFLGIWFGHHNTFHGIFGYFCLLCVLLFPTLGICADKRSDEFDEDGGPVCPHKMYRLLERVGIYGYTISQDYVTL